MPRIRPVETQFDNNPTALNSFRLFTGISDDSMERCQALISVAKLRNEPVVVQITSLSFSVVMILGRAILCLPASLCCNVDKCTVL